MDTFLHQPALFPSLTTTISAPGRQKPISSLPHSYGALAPLVRFVRRPSAFVGWLFDEFHIPASFSMPEQEIEIAETILRSDLQNATSLDDWRTAAVELDALEGNNDWKRELDSTEYNYELVQSRLEQLEDARISCDVARMLFLVRTSLTRHLGGMGNTLLYTHSRIGTKDLIEHYISSALATLSSLLDLTQKPRYSQLDTRDLLAQVLAARQSFGRSALLLSGGGTFGMSHAGVIKSLWDNKLLPRIISGASAGSIVCAVVCTRTDEEVPHMLHEFCYGDLDVFTKSGVDDGILRQASRFLTSGAIFDIANLIRVMRDLLGDMTFQEAYNRTRRILNICVSSAGLFELPRLLNYVTSPNVVIWSAVAASCSVPVIFSPAGLLAKDVRTGNIKTWNPLPQRWIDGSVDNDLPMTRLAEMFNVNHFIVSQVNPHVVPFLKKVEVHFAPGDSKADTSVGAGPGWWNLLGNLAKDEAMHRMHVLSELGIFPNLLTKTRSILSQRYSGDITILPDIPYTQFPNVLRNPTSDFMLQATLHGERATWPKLSRIQNHCAIELALDDAVQQLRARVAFSPSQVNLRLNALSTAKTRLQTNSEKSKSQIRSMNRKNLRFSLGNDQAMGRRFSSSESDSTWPSPSLIHDGRPTSSLQESRLATRKTTFGNRFDMNTPDVGLPGSETDSQTAIKSCTMDTSEDTPESDDEYSDSPTTEAMVSSLPTLWPSTRQLFPHASQPATPAHKTGLSYFINATPSSHLTPSVHPSPSSTKISTMTPLSAIDISHDFRGHVNNSEKHRHHNFATAIPPQ